MNNPGKQAAAAAAAAAAYMLTRSTTKLCAFLVFWYRLFFLLLFHLSISLLFWFGLLDLQRLAALFWWSKSVESFQCYPLKPVLLSFLLDEG